MTLNQLKNKIRENRHWGFLCEMIGETREPSPVMGVNRAGVLLVNPALAGQMPVNRLIRVIRNEFRVANELRTGVNGFV